ncbi:tectonic-1-like [Lampris incognitus]|uniref:tectonic-1-like n=1 Tax=Lampris incognitus TaxID=2546036 RepID=UPI0024B5BD82|nr:tectonic-1-like [Lampris incognitus]
MNPGHSFCLLLLSVAARAPTPSTDGGVADVFESVEFADIQGGTLEAELQSSPSVNFGFRPTSPTVPPDYASSAERGLLLTPAEEVVRWCPCNEQINVCDINCCCDSDCSEEVAVFTQCTIDRVSGNQKLCNQVTEHHSLGSTINGYSELHTSIQRDLNYDLFCIQSQNCKGLSYGLPAFPTTRNFDSLFEPYLDFLFASGTSSVMLPTAKKQASSGYQYGDVMVTVGRDGQQGILWLPVPSVTSNCLDLSPAAFLKQQRSSCSRSLVLDKDCSTLPALSMSTYTSIQLLSGKNEDAALVAVEVSSVVQQSMEGTWTQVKLGGMENLDPALLSTTVCTNVVLQVSFVVRYNRAGEITSVAASFVIGAISEDTLPLEQEFHITFVQENGDEVAFRYSGNPGYVVGLPLVSGTKSANGIGQSTDLRGTLTTLQGITHQDCFHGPHRRSPVLFGLNTVSGCMLSMEEAANCSLVSQVLLDILRGQNYPQYVAMFGSSPPHNPTAWLPVSNSSRPGEAQSCSIALSFHLEVEWTKYGSLVNPQAKIVSIKEVTQTNTSNLLLLSEGGSAISITSSVTFVPVSAAALPGSRAHPTVDANLPFDFFFPFV